MKYRKTMEAEFVPTDVIEFKYFLISSTLTFHTRDTQSCTQLFKMCKMMVVLIKLIKQKMVKFTILMLVIWNYFYILAEGPEIALVHSFPALVLTKYITHQRKMLLFHPDGFIKRQHLLRGLGGADS